MAAAAAMRVLVVDDQLSIRSLVRSGLKELGIMLTGRADRELVQRAVQFGVNDYLVKPFTVATLREKIKAVFSALT